MIDTSVIEHVRAASDIVATVGQTVELKPTGRELRGLCPLHEDHNPSLCINPEKQRWYCHPGGKGGDVFSWIMVRDGMDFPSAVRVLADGASIPLEPAQQPVSRQNGVTVAQWARAKRLDMDLIRALGITDTLYKGAPAVAFPYYVTGQDTAPVAVKIRRTLEKRDDVPRFEWRKGDKPVPYGLWLLPTSGARENGVFLVEGETDFLTLTQRAYPALGVPGNHWREEWTAFLDGVPRVHVVVETDNGGQRLVESLAKSSIWQRCALINIQSAAASRTGSA